MNPWLGIALVLGVLGILVGALSVFGQRLPAELSRKTVHVGMGLVCLSFPWLFQESWPVVVLAVLAVLGLAATRMIPWLAARPGRVLGGVGRRSLGEFYFPVAVAAVFVLSAGNVVLYLIPVLTLTVADSVGALIGVRYGLAKFRTDEGHKSAEGSIAFFTAAFLACHIPLLLSNQTGREEALLIGLTVGFIVMLLEAVSWRGLDNFIIPIGTFFLLERYVSLSMGALLGRFLVVLGLVLVVLIWRSRTTLSDSAVLAGALSGFAVWVLGGWFWLLPLLLLFAVYVGLPGFGGQERPIQNLHAVTRVMVGGIFWLLLALLWDRPDFLLPYFLCLAAHCGNIVTARLRIVRSGYSTIKILATAWGLAGGLYVLLAFAGVLRGVWPAEVIWLVPVAVAISIVGFDACWPTHHDGASRSRIWLTETGIAIVASLVGLWGLPL